MKAAALILSAVALSIGGALAAARQEPEIRSFVRQVYIEGVPFEEVQKFDKATAAPVLLKMLEDAREEKYWPNIVVTLGMLGDARAVEPLIQFVEKGSPGTLSHARYIAKTSAVMSLGYIVNKSKSDKALSYLIGVLILRCGSSGG
jgi:HEAT repeat protein